MSHVMFLCVYRTYAVVVYRLTLGRPSSPILQDKIASPVLKDAPVEIDQVSS